MRKNPAWLDIIIWKIATVLSPIEYNPDMRDTLLFKAVQRALDLYMLAPASHMVYLHSLYGVSQLQVIEKLVKLASHVIEVELGQFALTTEVVQFDYVPRITFGELVDNANEYTRE